MRPQCSAGKGRRAVRKLELERRQSTAPGHFAAPLLGEGVGARACDCQRQLARHRLAESGAIPGPPRRGGQYRDRDREWELRVGTIGLQIPKPRAGS